MATGSIEERGGRHRVRLRVAGRKRSLGTYATEAEAEAVLEAAREQLEAAGSTSLGRLTLRQWIERWLDQRELSGAVRSVADDRSRLRAHVLGEPWADDPLDTITRPLLRAWVRRLLGRQARHHAGAGELVDAGRRLSRITVQHVVATLRVCLRDACEDEKIASNPAADLRVPAALYTREPWTYLEPREIAALLGCEAIPEPFRLLYAVAVYTGLRKGELWGLRWGDVALAGQRPHVMVRRSRDSAPKNGKHRMVPLLAPARVALERLRQLADRTGSDALVFPARDGGMRRRDNDARWPEYRKLAGITRPVRFHDLRHTCASLLLMGAWGRAWRLERVRDFLGHSDVAVTQRYAHLSPDHLHDEAALTVGPIVAPGATSSAAAASPESSTTAGVSDGSHLRDLNPRPTVYECGGGQSEVAHIERIGASVGPGLLADATALLRRAQNEGVVDLDAGRALALAVLDQSAVRLARAVLEPHSAPKTGAAAVALAAELVTVLTPAASRAS